MRASRDHLSSQFNLTRFFAVLLFAAMSVVGPFDAVAQEKQSGDDSDLTARVEQLEQQLVEMQVTIGTLESLTRGRPSGGAASYQAPSSGSGNASQLEQQVQIMSGQIDRLSRQVQAMQAAGGLRGQQQVARPYTPPTPSSAAQDSQSTTDTGGFGTVTVTSAQPSKIGDPIGTILSGSGETGQTKVAAVEQVSPRAAYDKAYGYLLEQDYGAAEVAFGDFVKKHPKDKLAGNAQYWLGESHYVRGNYRTAANAFLKGFKTYRKSNKAPDSLLKLAMSLSRLGQKPSACSTLKELQRRYPSAPSHIRQRSQAERQRAGC